MAKAETIKYDDSWLPPSGHDTRIPKLNIDQDKFSTRGNSMEFDYAGYHIVAKPEGYTIYQDGKVIHEVTDKTPTVVGTSINRSLTFIETLVNAA